MRRWRFSFVPPSQYPNARLTGIDSSPDLVEKSRQTVPGACFFVADIGSKGNLPQRSFDIVFMSGVNYLFDDFEPG